MEYRVEDQNFRRRFKTRLDKLSILYAKDENKFLKEFMSLDKKFLVEMARCRIRVEMYRDSRLSEIVEYASEVLYYYESIYKREFKKDKALKDKEKEQEALKPKSFTLHNPEDVERFEGFLDRMLKLLEVNETLFVETLPKCPVELWDKIDDLRETSYKEDRDSPEYTRCLQKCKKISISYFKLSRPPSRYVDNTDEDDDDEYD